MAHEVESMFYTREAPWHGLGERVDEALNSSEALKLAGLDWKVIQRPVFTDDDVEIAGYKANVRSRDGKVLGIVSDRYKVVQNNEAFQFTDALIGNGVRYETAGSLQGGKRVWMLAHLPDTYKICGDEVKSYILFSNSHDGSGAIRVAVTPIRVVCQNTLNLALSDAYRIWSTMHVGDMNQKLDEARKTLLYAEQYMHKLTIEGERLSRISLTDKKVKEFIEELIPMPEDPSAIQQNNIDLLRTDMKLRYFDAPDLIHVPKNGWRFINAVSDFATHAKPLRKTASYKENLFAKTVDGNPLIDKAYELLESLV
jgi:phage/plasmid-like protein (TIGR03299 family)